MADSAKDLQPWQWPEAHWRALVNQVRAGRSYRPPSWKGGARCAIALSFDSDHETNELRDGGTSKHLACGDGYVDCAKSLKLLKDGGFRGWIMVDEWEVPDPYDACIKCKRAIDQAWGA